MPRCRSYWICRASLCTTFSYTMNGCNATILHLLHYCVETFNHKKDSPLLTFSPLYFVYFFYFIFFSISAIDFGGSYWPNQRNVLVGWILFFLFIFFKPGQTLSTFRYSQPLNSVLFCVTIYTAVCGKREIFFSFALQRKTMPSDPQPTHLFADS